jgi:hypothetical protein
METDINKMSDRISNIYLDIFILWIDILASVKLQGLFSKTNQRLVAEN